MVSGSGGGGGGGDGGDGGGVSKMPDKSGEQAYISSLGRQS